MVIRFIPNDTSRSQQKFDFAGAGLMFVFMASLLFALSVSQQSGFNNPVVFALLALAISSLIAFIVIENKTSHPMIDLKMFQNRQFSINLITGFMIFLSVAGTSLLFPLYLQNVLHYNSQQTGLMLAVTPICVSIIAPLSGALSDRTGSRPITTLGLLILIIGFFAVSTLSEATSTWGYLLRFIPVGVGIGLFQSPNNSAVMGSVARENLGVASGLLSLTRTVGQTAGIAILSAFWENRVAFYHGSFVESGATYAPVADQVAGLLDTVHLTTAILVIAFLISSWALVEFVKLKRSSPDPSMQ